MRSKQTDWKDIQNIILTEHVAGPLPVRMKLIRTNGTVVVSGGVNLAEAAVVLFYTAGLGRFPPKILAKKLKWEIFAEVIYTAAYKRIVRLLAS